MKQLTCEMCGSTDLVKQDGFFVCQTCGCKYSVEEAKKMMIEGTVKVQGTVRVDKSDSIETYLSMAKNAFDAGNNAEVELYCNKIIEISPDNYEAWYMKGYAVGWQSTLGKIRIPETVNAYSNALEFCPEIFKEELSSKCSDSLLRLHKALLSARLDFFKDNPSDKNTEGIKSDVNLALSNSVKFIKKTGTYTKNLVVQLALVLFNGANETWENVYKEYSEDNDRHPSDNAFKRFLDEGDNVVEIYKTILLMLDEDPDTPSLLKKVQKLLDDESAYSNNRANKLMIAVYNKMIICQEKMRDSCSYECKYTSYGKYYEKSLSLTEKGVEARNYFIKMYKGNIETIKESMRETYWENHQDEKESLDSEKVQLESVKEKCTTQIADLQKSKEKVPSLELLVKKQKEIETIETQKKSLGLFKFKEKNALQEKIVALIIEKDKIKAKVTAEQQEIEKQITPIRAELNKAIARIKEIDNELTMDRDEEEEGDE